MPVRRGLVTTQSGLQEPGVVHLDELHRGSRQRLEQAVVRVGLGLRFGLDPEDQCAHGLRV